MTEQRGRARRLLIVLPHLGLGGTQQVAMRMIGYWLDRRHEVTVVTWARTDDYFRPSPRVRRIRLREPRSPRWAHFVARLVERRRTPAAGRAKRAGGARETRAAEAAGAAAAGAAKAPGILAAGASREPAAKTSATLGLRPLDPARAAYTIAKRLLAAATVGIVRHKLFGCSFRAYAWWLRLVDWRIRYLRRIFVEARPDVVLAMLSQTSAMAVAASSGLPHRIVVSERSDLEKQVVEEPWNTARALLYPLADAISANSPGTLEALGAWCAGNKLHYVPNPLRLPANGGEGARSHAILFLGRLITLKAPDVLIEAFARFHRSAPDWRLDIAGGGPLAQPLAARVDALGLSDCVAFLGVVADPRQLLARCGIFSLPSRFEGTPNALLEAMSYRAACIVTDASPGPLQLVADGETGLVVKTDSVEDLAGALERLASDEPLRRRLGAAAFERVREFDIERVRPVWDRILFPGDGPRPAAS